MDVRHITTWLRGLLRLEPGRVVDLTQLAELADTVETLAAQNRQLRRDNQRLAQFAVRAAYVAQVV